MLYNDYNMDDSFEVTPTTTAAPVAPEDQDVVLQNKEDQATAEQIAQELSNQINSFEKIPQTFTADYEKYDFLSGATAPTPGSIQSTKRFLQSQAGVFYTNDGAKATPLLNRNFEYLEKISGLTPQYQLDQVKRLFTGLNKFPVIDGKPVTIDNIEQLMSNPITKAKIMKVAEDYKKLPEYTENWELSWDVQVNDIEQQRVLENYKEGRSIINKDLYQIADQLDAQEQITPSEKISWLGGKIRTAWANIWADEYDPKTGKKITPQKLQYYGGKHKDLFNDKGELMTKREFRVNFAKNYVQEGIDAINNLISINVKASSEGGLPVIHRPNEMAYYDQSGVRHVTRNYNKMKELQEEEDRKEAEAKRQWEQTRSRMASMGILGDPYRDDSKFSPEQQRLLNLIRGQNGQASKQSSNVFSQGVTSQTARTGNQIIPEHNTGVLRRDGTIVADEWENWNSARNTLIELQKKGVTDKNYISVLNTVKKIMNKVGNVPAAAVTDNSFDLTNVDGMYDNRLLNIKNSYNNPKVLGPSFVRPLFTPGKNPFNTPSGNRGEYTQAVPVILKYNLNGKKFLDDDGQMRPETIEFSNVIELGFDEPTTVAGLGRPSANGLEDENSSTLKSFFRKVGENLYNGGEESKADKPYGNITFLSVAAGKPNMYAYNVTFDTDYLKKFVGTKDDKGVLYDIKQDEEKWKTLTEKGVTIYVPQKIAEEYKENEETGKLDMKSIFGYHAMRARQVSPEEAMFQRTGKIDLTISKSGSTIITRNKDNSLTITGYREHLNPNTRKYERKNLNVTTIPGSDFFDLDDLISRTLTEMKIQYKQNYNTHNILLQADKIK